MVGFSGAILTGGRSTRMGRDKALVELRGRPLVSYPLAALTAAGAAELLAVGGDSPALAALGLTPVVDRRAGDGPLAGVLRALEVASEELVVVLACDVPAVTPEVIRDLVGAASPGAGSLAVVGGQRQPLLGVYRRGLRPALETAFEEGVRALRAATADLPFSEVPFDDERLARNLNTAEELRAAETWMR